MVCGFLLMSRPAFSRSSQYEPTPLRNQLREKSSYRARMTRRPPSFIPRIGIGCSPSIE